METYRHLGFLNLPIIWNRKIIYFLLSIRLATIQTIYCKFKTRHAGRMPSLILKLPKMSVNCGRNHQDWFFIYDMRQIRLCTAIAKIHFLHPRPVTLVYTFQCRPTIGAQQFSHQVTRLYFSVRDSILGRLELNWFK